MKDNIDLADLLVGNVSNATDIKHMKDTLDQHTVDISDIKSSQTEMMSDMKAANKGINHITATLDEDKEAREERAKYHEEYHKRVDIIELKQKWMIGSILTFFSGVGGVIAVFWKKVAILLAL